MASPSRQSNSRPTPSQTRRARRVRRARRRRLRGYLIGAGVALIATALIASLFIPSLPLDSLFSGGAPEGPGERMTDLGRTHVLPGEEHPSYNSTPGTSGWHYDVPLAPARWGMHDEPIVDEILIHNLEHGYVNVHYDCPDGCDDLVESLAALVEEGVERGAKLLMAPYPDMDARIALTAWTFIDKFDEFDEDRIRDFVSAHESSPNAPEYRVAR